MEQSPFWETDTLVRSASQEILRLLWNPKVHYRIKNYTVIIIIIIIIIVVVVIIIIVLFNFTMHQYRNYFISFCIELSIATNQYVFIFLIPVLSVILFIIVLDNTSPFRHSNFCVLLNSLVSN
jgi:hypothetical protein